MSEGIFEKYPIIEIIADPYEPQYRIRYTECVKEVGIVRFEKREKIIQKSNIEGIISDILEKRW